MTFGWFTKVLASTVLSPLGRCSSRANTTQLAMMVNSTAYSNGVQDNWIKKKYSNKITMSCTDTKMRGKKYYTITENVIYYFYPGLWLMGIKWNAMRASHGHKIKIRVHNKVFKRNRIPIYTKRPSKTKVQY